MSVVVLNFDYTYLNTVSLRKAIKYIIKRKVETVRATSEVLSNMEGTCQILNPLIIRLIKFVRIVYKTRVPYSRRNIMVRDKFKCQYCNSTKILTIDHIIPISRGGKSTWENCTTACRKCNNLKGDKTPNELKMTLLSQPHQPTIMEFIREKMKRLKVDELLKELEIH